jgi:hypothetical protein
MMALVVAALLLIGGGTLAVSMWGQVDGEEFSATRFARRSYSFLQVPVLKLQVTPVTRTATDNELLTSLRRNQHIQVGPLPKATWHVMHVREGLRYERGSAAILNQYLDARDGDDQLVWMAWTEAHPEWAKPFWSAVQELAQLEAYELLPELFELASQAETGDPFPSQLDQLVADKLSALGDDYIQTNQSGRAESCYAAALRHQPDDAALREKHRAVQPSAPPPKKTADPSAAADS